MNEQLLNITEKSNKWQKENSENKGWNYLMQVKNRNEGKSEGKEEKNTLFKIEKQSLLKSILIVALYWLCLYLSYFHCLYILCAIVGPCFQNEVELN